MPKSNGRFSLNISRLIELAVIAVCTGVFTSMLTLNAVQVRLEYMKDDISDLSQQISDIRKDFYKPGFPSAKSKDKKERKNETISERRTVHENRDAIGPELPNSTH